MVKRVVNSVDVVDVEKRRVPSKHYVYVVNVNWSDGSRTVVFRRYSRFFELQVRILELFPEEGGEDDPTQRMIPFLPGKIIFGRSHVRNVAMKRLTDIDEYCKALIRLPPHISECFDVLQFFQVEDDDLNPVRDEKDARKNQDGKSSTSKSKMVGEVISEPMLLEQYVAIADYKKKQKNEVNLSAGVSVEVVEKNENGWWFVNVEEEQGWVPASYLEPAEGGGQAKEAQTVASKGDEEKFVTTQEYKAQARDEISFEKGVVVEVVQKNLEGWWRVRYQGKEGIVPAAYLQYMSARPAENAPTSEVQVVSTAHAAVTDTLQNTKQTPGTGGGAAAAGLAAESLRKPTVPDNPLLSPSNHRQSGALPPRRQSIKVTKKMRSQTRTKQDTSSALRSAAAAASVAETPAGTQAKKKASSSSIARQPSSESHAFVTCTYEAVGDSELSVHEGDEVEVIERNESGWWFVDLNGKQGWVPSSSFSSASDLTSPPDTPGRTSPKVDDKAHTSYVTVADFSAAADDGISFSADRPVKVLEMASSGWWYVVIDGKEGWAPSSYLKEDTKSDAAAKSSSAPVSPPSSGKNSSSSRNTSLAKQPQAIDISKVGLRPTKSTPTMESAAPAAATSAKSSGSTDGGVGAMQSQLAKVSLRPTKSTGTAKPTPAAQGSDNSSTSSKSRSSVHSTAAASSGHGSVAAAAAALALKPVGSKASPLAHETDGSDETRSKPIKLPAAKEPKASPRPLRPPGGKVDKASGKTSPKPTFPPSPTSKPSAGHKSSVKSTATPNAKKDEKPKAKPQPQTPEKVKSTTGGNNYKATADYADTDKDNLSFKEGDVLQLVEKNDSGWWLMKLGSCEGWAPSTYFDAIADDPPKPKKTGPPIPTLPAAPGNAKTPGSVKTVGASSKSEPSSSGKRQSALKPPQPAGRSVSPGGGKKKPEKPSAPPSTGGSGSKGAGDTKDLYVVSADYTADGPDEISLRSGDDVTVLEMADSGWWCVRSRGKEGWAPSTYLEKKKVTVKASGSSRGGGTAALKPGRPKPPKKGGNRASAAYHGEEGEVSFEEGDTLEIVEKADTGWWYVRTSSGQEGWAPSTFIE
ncbi:SH3 and PX domain-containing protein 2B-like isoform X1 [Sycon ciliatum]|uniref:SH3 and PX domain-containing protein 2B-like isoform X1 n=1 Tax=Sycon ciliatum TaxID=27933 RepID=UPI0031F6BDD5